MLVKKELIFIQFCLGFFKTYSSTVGSRWSVCSQWISKPFTFVSFPFVSGFIADMLPF
jgi:hypothetical protein